MLSATGIKSKGDGVQVTWDNPEELERYIQQLQAAADRLTSENRKLRKCHLVVSDKVLYGAGHYTHIYSETCLQGTPQYPRDNVYA